MVLTYMARPIDIVSCSKATDCAALLAQLKALLGEDVFQQPQQGGIRMG